MKVTVPIGLEGWDARPIGDVFTVNPETLPSSTPADYQFRYIPLESVYSEHIDFASVQQIQFGEAPSRARRIIRRGDLLVSTVRPQLQGFAEFQPPDDEPYVCSTGFAVLRAKNGHDQQFYLQELLSDFGARQFHAYVTGTNYPAISDRDLKRIMLLTPRTGLERQAAAALRDISTGITLARNSLAKTDRLNLGLMQQLLSGRMRPDASLRRADEFVEHHKLGFVPKGWRACRVRDIATKVTDGEHVTPQRCQTGYYLLSARNIGMGRLLLQDVDFIDEPELLRIRKRCDPDEGDLLISCSGTIGNVCLVPRGLVCGMVRSAALVKLAREKAVPKFIEWLFRASPMQRQMQVAASVSIQGNLFQGSIRRLWIMLPLDLEEQAAIADRLCSVEGLIRAKEEEIAALQRLKKSLMQHLLTGRIRLPVNGEVVQEAAQ